MKRESFSVSNDRESARVSARQSFIAPESTRHRYSVAPTTRSRAFTTGSKPLDAGINTLAAARRARASVAAFSPGNKNQRDPVFVLALTFPIMLGYGILFSLSGFEEQLKKDRPKWSSHVMESCTSLALAGFLASMPMNPWFLRKMGTNIMGVTASAISSVGVCIAAGAAALDLVGLFKFGLGFCLGFGAGMLFAVMQVIVLEFFPTRRGTVGGFFGLCTGIGSVVFLFVPLEMSRELDISECLLATAAMIFSLQATFVFPIRVDRADPKDADDADDNVVAPKASGLMGFFGVIGRTVGVVFNDLKNVLNPKFCSVFVIYTSILIPGWGVASDLSSLIDDVTHKSGDHALGQKAIVLLAFGVGRFLWTIVSDNIGAINTYAINSCTQLAIVLVLPHIANRAMDKSADKVSAEGTVTIVLVALLLACFGGGASLISALVGEVWREGLTRVQAGIYVSYLLVGYGLSGIISPLLFSNVAFDTFCYVCTGVLALLISFLAVIVFNAVATSRRSQALTTSNAVAGGVSAIPDNKPVCPQEVLVATHAPEEKARVLAISREIIAEGTSYEWTEEITDEFILDYWYNTPKARVFVVLGPKEGSPREAWVNDVRDEVVAMYNIHPNRTGRAAHIGHCSYLVSAHARGKRLGRLIVQHSIAQAREMGFKGIQFNLVVGTNVAAVDLYRSCGFEIVGTIPGAFDHKEKGYVNAHIMFRPISQEF